MPEPQTDTALAQEVLRLAEKATPPPWFITGFDTVDDDGKERSNTYIVSEDDTWICAMQQREYVADAEFIAYCRQAAPDLARRLLEAKEENLTYKICHDANVKELHRADAEIGTLRATLSERERELAEAKGGDV